MRGSTTNTFTTRTDAGPGMPGMPAAPAASGRRPARRRRGSALMEAALVLPILLLLSCGVIEFGHFFFVKHTLQGAARDGCRVSILPSATNTSVTNAVAATMTAAGFTADKYTLQILSVNPSTLAEAPVNVATAPTGTALKVKVTCTWGTVGVRVIGPLSPLAPSKQITGFTLMVKE